ncbi:MAG: pyridoxamine 5'-phosphate oxidase family protein [Muricomes sp.]
MFREMRRTDRQLTEEETLQILRDNQYGVLSTAGVDGYPYGVPLSYAYMDGKIYFHGTNADGLKRENIEHSSKACFTVIGNTEVLPSKFSTNYESAIAFGQIKVSEDTQEVLRKLIQKYSPEFLESGEKYIASSMQKVTVYEFEIEYITGKGRKHK